MYAQEVLGWRMLEFSATLFAKGARHAVRQDAGRDQKLT